MGRLRPFRRKVGRGLHQSRSYFAKKDGEKDGNGRSFAKSKRPVTH